MSNIQTTFRATAFTSLGLLKQLSTGGVDAVKVVKSRLETKISGEWLGNEIDEYMFHLQNAGFNVRAIVADDHASNVSAFSLLHKSYDGDGKLFIYNPPYGKPICFLISFF